MTIEFIVIRHTKNGIARLKGMIMSAASVLGTSEEMARLNEKSQLLLAASRAKASEIKAKHEAAKNLELLLKEEAKNKKAAESTQRSRERVVGVLSNAGMPQQLIQTLQPQLTHTQPSSAPKPFVLTNAFGATRLVRCNETGSVFNSAKEAALALNVRPDAVAHVLRGRIAKTAIRGTGDYLTFSWVTDSSLQTTQKTAASAAFVLPEPITLPQFEKTPPAVLTAPPEAFIPPLKHETERKETVMTRSEQEALIASVAMKVLESVAHKQTAQNEVLKRKMMFAAGITFAIILATAWLL